MELPYFCQRFANSINVRSHFHIIWPTERHLHIRKVTKNWGVFPLDTALRKLLYYAFGNIRKRWMMPMANWPPCHNYWP